jgi:alcohol dehydrogenase (cytochrome c)/quinohemoprotein ethanol dehydrogenase
VWDLTAGVLARKSGPVRNVSRMLVFELGGTATLPPLTPATKLVLDPPAPTGTPQQTADGAYRYANSCGGCHGDAAVAGTLVTDLRTSPALNNPDLWKQIVLDGAMKDRGMVGWSANFTPEQVENIRLYVIKRANEDKALEEAARAAKTAQ